MITPRLSLLLAAALPLAAAAPVTAPPKPAPYVPDPKVWRLELKPDLGGWLSSPTIQLRLKIVDPRDPEPPKDDEALYEYPDFEGDEVQDADDVQGDADVAGARARAEARRREREEAEARNLWRSRTLKVWFNGAEKRVTTRVGYGVVETLDCQDGENRLEILEPDSGLRTVRTWWASARNTRLQIVQVRAADEYTGGSMEVMEPDGAIAGSWRNTPSGGQGRWNQFLHATPPAGTYTIRWTPLYREAKPCTVVVEALLDGGTERERRWTFTRLIIPGTGHTILGTLDVEN